MDAHQQWNGALQIQTSVRIIWATGHNTILAPHPVRDVGQVVIDDLLLRWHSRRREWFRLLDVFLPISNVVSRTQRRGMLR